MMYKYLILIASKLKAKYCFIDLFFCKKGRDVISIDYAFAQNQSTLMTSTSITSVAKLRYSCILLMTIKHVKHKA